MAIPAIGICQKKNKSKKDKSKEDMTLINQGENTEVADTSSFIKTPEEKQVTLYKEGIVLMDSTDFEGAIKKFKKATKIKNDYYEAYLKSAQCKMKLEDYKGAQKDLVDASNFGPNDFETLKLKAINYYMMKNYADSKIFMDSAMIALEEEKIDDVEFIYYHAKLMHAGKAYKEALEMCEVALEVNRNYYDAMILKCQIRFDSKQFKYAERELDSTIYKLPEDKKDYNLYRLRAITRFELKNYKGAVSDWNVYIDAEPDNEEAYIGRAASKININDFTGAIVDLDQAIKMNPKNHISFCYRGLAKGSNKQIVEGIKDLDYSIKLKFDYAEGYVNRAALKMAAKDKRGACNDLAKGDSLGNELAMRLYDQYCKN
ncbi:MAG: tetratricopeptide repeat protein [Bacteroidia bacterium]